jgi:hypothetical protein
MVEPIGPEAVVQQNTGFLVNEFEHDIQALLARRPLSEARTQDRRWVVVYKTAEDQLTTLQIGDRTKHLLEQAKSPVRVKNLITDPDESGLEFHLAAIQTLTRIGLLSEVAPS